MTLHPAKALGLLILMGMFWGLQFAMLKLAAEGGYDELTVLLLALAALSVIFSAIAYGTGERLRFSAIPFRFILIISILGYVAPLLAALYAAPHLSVGMLSLIVSFSPVVALVGSLMLRVEGGAGWIVAVGLGVASIAIALWPELSLPGWGAAPWMLVAGLVALFYGVESVYIARAWPGTLSPLMVLTMQTIMALFLVVILWGVYGAPPQKISWSMAELAILVFVGSGVIESVIYFYLIRHAGAVYVNFGTFISLFAGLGWGMMLFDERHPVTTWVAAGLLVIALGLIYRRRPI